LDDILDEPIVAATGRGVWRDYWLATDYRRNRPAAVSLEVSTIESELQAIASGKGISITSQSTAMYYARPGVVFRTIVDMQDCIVAIGSRRTSNPLIADFISVAKNVSSSILKLGAPGAVVGTSL
jgi:DNA-binding transcriptional LysR family regulator